MFARNANTLNAQALNISDVKKLEEFFTLDDYVKELQNVFLEILRSERAKNLNISTREEVRKLYEKRIKEIVYIEKNSPENIMKQYLNMPRDLVNQKCRHCINTCRLSKVLINT